MIVFICTRPISLRYFYISSSSLVVCIIWFEIKSFGCKSVVTSIPTIRNPSENTLVGICFMNLYEKIFAIVGLFSTIASTSLDDVEVKSNNISEIYIIISNCSLITETIIQIGIIYCTESNMRSNSKSALTSRTSSTRWNKFCSTIYWVVRAVKFGSTYVNRFNMCIIRLLGIYRSFCFACKGSTE